MISEKKISQLLEKMSGKRSVKSTDGLQNDLGFDSLGMVTLLIEIEEEFGIELAESDMNPFDLSTVADVVKLVGKYGENNEKKN